MNSGLHSSYKPTSWLPVTTCWWPSHSTGRNIFLHSVLHSLLLFLPFFLSLLSPSSCSLSLSLFFHLYVLLHSLHSYILLLLPFSLFFGLSFSPHCISFLFSPFSFPFFQSLYYLPLLLQAGFPSLSLSISFPVVIFQSFASCLFYFFVFYSSTFL